MDFACGWSFTGSHSMCYVLVSRFYQLRVGIKTNKTCIRFWETYKIAMVAGYLLFCHPTHTSLASASLSSPGPSGYENVYFTSSESLLALLCLCQTKHHVLSCWMKIQWFSMIDFKPKSALYAWNIFYIVQTWYITYVALLGLHDSVALLLPYPLNYLYCCPVRNPSLQTPYIHFPTIPKQRVQMLSSICLTLTSV